MFFLLLLLRFTFYFSSFQLDTPNDLMCDENTTHCIALSELNNVLLLCFCFLLVSFIFIFFYWSQQRPCKQTILTIEMLTKLSAYICYSFIYRWKDRDTHMHREREQERFVCISFDSRYQKIQIEKQNLNRAHNSIRG